MSTLPIFKNSSYARGRKYIVDAEQLNTAFAALSDSVGTTSIRDVIESTGQIYNPLDAQQFSDALAQLIVSANYFKDIGTVNNVVLDAYVPGYGKPTKYVDKMSVKFRPKYQNTASTTIAFKNMSGVPLLTDTYSQLNPGTLIPNSDFQAVYSESKGAFILSSTVEDSGSLALNEIRRLIDSAGISFSNALEDQLAQSVALYSLATTYDNISDQPAINSNNYILKPKDKYQQIPEYKNGLVIRFRPIFSNTLTNPTIQVYGMQRLPLISSDGDTIPEGSISTDYDVVVRYDNGVFYLVSNYLSSLKLQNGRLVTGISNDASLIGSSQDSLVTEYAVKTYVDSKINSDKNYVVVSGESDELGNPAYIEKTTDTVATILAGEVGVPSYTNLATIDNSVASPNKEETVDPEDPEDITTYDLSNCFDGDNSTYYETEDTGSTVIGKPNLNKEGEYSVMPNYIGVDNLTQIVTRVRLLGVDTFSMPSSVFFQYSIDSGTTWYNVGTTIYDDVNEQGTIVKKVLADTYNVPFVSGEFSNLDLKFKPYVDPTDPENSEIANTYSIRCYAKTFTGTDTGWKLIAFEFCVSSGEIQPLVLSYEDGTTEIVTSKGTVSTSGLLDQEGVILKTYGGDYEVVDKSAYFESNSMPTDIEDGLYWVKLDNKKVSTFMTVEDDDGNVSFQPSKFIKVGTVKLSNGIITEIYPSAFNAEYSRTNLELQQNSVSINHNIGSLSRAKMYITCVSADLGYDVGDTVELCNQAVVIGSGTSNMTTVIGNTDLNISDHVIGGETYGHTVSPNPHTHTATTVIDTSGFKVNYVSISCGYNSAKLMYSAIVLPNKNNGILQQITIDRWTLSAFCERNF